MKAKETRYIRKESKWQTYHKIENSQKARAFKKMPETTSIKSLKDIYHFAYMLGIEKKSRKEDFTKIKTLAYIHSIFGKVSP